MSTMTGNLRRAMLLGAVGALVLAGAATIARADVASDKPGAVLIFPKIVVDPSGVLTNGIPTDTEVQITNTSNSVVGARCFLVDQTSHCSNTSVCSNATTVTLCTSDSGCPGSVRGSCVPAACTAAAVADGADPGLGGCNPGGVCVPPCSPKVVENDFNLTLTKRQPISWKASEGRPSGPSVPGVQEVPFVGEIKCVEADPATFQPISGLDPNNNFIGDLKGEATMVSSNADHSILDARKYNGIGLQASGSFPATFPTDPDGNITVNVGGPSAQYNGCPKVIMLDSLFDGAPLMTHQLGVTHSVTTDLTVVPCSEDFATQQPTSATLQFLVFNEFEQRFSTSTGFRCFRETSLSDIDSRPGEFGDAQSIFNFAVEGTLAGQVRIRPVAGSTSDRGVLAVTEEFWTTGSDVHTSATNENHTLRNPITDPGLGDTIRLPAVLP